MKQSQLCIFALGSSREYGERLATHLDIPLSEHEEREFEDGEHKSRPLVSVRAKDVFVVHSLYGDGEQSVNDKLCRLLFFIGAVRDAGAERVTAVVPYLCYTRKDRKTKSRDPVTLRYVASMFEAVGTNRVVTMDVHNLAAFQNAFRCSTEHLEATTLFVRHFADLLGAEEVAVVSPDIGGVKRAEQFREALSGLMGTPVAAAFLEKRRSEGVVSSHGLVGQVAGRSIILYDDLISGGTTMIRAAKACRAEGATRVFAAASHGMFIGGAEQLFGRLIDSVVVTDTVPHFRVDPSTVTNELVTLDSSALFAEAISRIHEGGSIVELLTV